MKTTNVLSTGNPLFDHWLHSDTDECFIVQHITDADYTSPPGWWCTTIIAAPRGWEFAGGPTDDAESPHWLDRDECDDPEDAIDYPGCPSCRDPETAPIDDHVLECPTCGCIFEEDDEDGTLLIIKPGVSELGRLL